MQVLDDSMGGLALVHQQVRGWGEVPTTLEGRGAPWTRG